MKRFCILPKHCLILSITSLHIVRDDADTPWIKKEIKKSLVEKNMVYRSSYDFNRRAILSEKT